MAISYPSDGNALYFQIEDGSYWFRHRNRCITAAVGRFPPPGRIVDIGGGNGYVARALIDAGFPTMLVEPGVEGAKNASMRRGIPDVINATLEDAGLAPGSICSAGLFDVIEHMEDDGALLADVARLLAPGGTVYVTVPAHQWLWSNADAEGGHFRRYSASQLSDRFRKQGLDVLYVSYFFESLLLPLFLLRTLPYALGLRKRHAESDYRREHRAEGVAGAVVQSLLARETRVIARGGTLMTGTSCLLVARKPA